MKYELTFRWGPKDEEERVAYVDRIPCVGEWFYVQEQVPGTGQWPVPDEGEGQYLKVTEVRWYGKDYGNGINMRAWIYLDGAEAYDRVDMPELNV